MAHLNPPRVQAPRCTPTTGRVVFATDTRTHRHLPNLCRRWDCGYCSVSRAMRLLQLLALHHEHDRRNAPVSTPRAEVPSLSVYQLPATTLQRRVDRSPVLTSRLTIVRGAASVSICSHDLGPAKRGGILASESSLVEVLDFFAQTALNLPGVTRARWSGSWSDRAPDHIPAEIPLRDIPRHLLPSVFDIAVDAAVRRWGCRWWNPLEDSVPKGVPDAWWLLELRRAATLFGGG